MAINKRLIPKDCSDAFLVKGCYEKDPQIKEALGERLSDYYFDNYYRLFRVRLADAEEIFQMSAKAILVNIYTRRIYVNDDGELIGTKNKPFTSALTTYFMNIAKNMYHEWLRLHKDDTDKDPERLPTPSKGKRSGMSVPYEIYEEEENKRSGRWFWYFNGRSTGIEVKKGEPGSKLTKQMPYIGDDLHWWIGADDNATDIGALYNDMRYDDKEITQLTKIARCISQMTCMCKHILTYSLYLEKSNDEIAVIKGYKDSDTVKSKKHDCLKTLKSMVSGAHC